jgi:hypothetical protein
MSTCLSFGFLSRPALVWKSSAHRWSGESETRRLFPAVQLQLVPPPPPRFTKIKEGILDQGGHSDLPNPCVRAYCCLCIRVLNIDVLVLMYSSAMATRSICRQSNAPGRFQWRSTSASLFTSQGRPVSDIHQLHCRLFCKVIPRAVFQGSPLSRVPEGKWLKNVCTTPHSVVPL